MMRTGSVLHSVLFSKRHKGSRRPTRPACGIWLGILLASQALSLSEQVGETPLAGAVVDRLLERYRSINSLSAEFTQRLIGHNLEQEERGFLLLKQPDKMYWEYQMPRKKIFVTDGRLAFVYVPEDRQVFEYELHLDTAQTPLLFLFGKEDVRSLYEVEFEMNEAPLQPDNLLIRLTPQVPRPDYTHVLLEIDPSNYLIQRLVVIEPIGNENHYLLSEIQENIKIPDGRFRFKIPPGVEHIRLDRF